MNDSNPTHETPDDDTRTVEAYIAAVPQAARARLDELRELVRQELPDAHEVISYGIIGYKPDPKRRAVVYISGWKDHIAVYPIPRDERLQKDLAPYTRGKGTLWFTLDAPLPVPLIRKVIRALS